MVTRWGLSDKLGPLTYGDDEGEVFLGHSVTKSKEISDDTAHLIDTEVREIIDRTYQRAKQILEEKMSILHEMAKTLMQYETIDESQLRDLMKGETPKPPKNWVDKQKKVHKEEGESSDSENLQSHPDNTSPASGNS